MDEVVFAQTIVGSLPLHDANPQHANSFKKQATTPEEQTNPFPGLQVKLPLLQLQQVAGFGEPEELDDVELLVEVVLVEVQILFVQA